MTDELDKKKQFRDAMWNYFGITEDNDLKWYEDIYESVVQPFCELECNKAVHEYAEALIDIFVNPPAEIGAAEDMHLHPWQIEKMIRESLKHLEGLR